MNLSKRQKMLLAGLGVAVGGFLIDAMLPGPSAASASILPTPVTNPGPLPANPGTPPVVTTSINENHDALMRVVNRLRSVELPDDEHAEPIPDPFAYGSTIIASEISEGSISIETIDESDPAARPLNLQPPPLVPNIRISSIMNAQEGRIALIDGELRREGDRVAGWTITRIADRSIRLSNGSHEVRVPMDP